MLPKTLFPKSSRDDGLIVRMYAPRASEIYSNRRDPAETHVEWGELPTVGDVRHLVIMVDSREESRFNRLPQSVLALKRLRSLRMPVHLFAGDFRLPPVSRDLHLMSSSTISKVTIPDSFRNGRLRSLILPCDTKINCEFDPSSFPRLNHLCIRFNQRQSMVPRLAELKRLTLLHATNLKDFRSLERLVPNQIRALSLFGGASSLADLPAMTALEELELLYNRNLEDISPLLRQPNLQRLWIQACSKLKNLEVLLKLKSLRSLYMTSCKKIGIKQYRDRFEAMGLEYLSLGNCT